MIYALWHGGYSYGPGDMVNDLECFDSLAVAQAALESRSHNGDYYRQTFPFVNRDPESVFCPGVSDNTSLWVWEGADLVDGVTYVPDYPDWVIEYDAHGKVQVIPG